MPMMDPVIASDGYSYERSQLNMWFERKLTSPITGARMEHKFVIPNHALRNTIAEIMEKQVE